MSELLSGKGSCLCGAVTLSTATMSKNVGVCHCGMCRAWAGGPLMVVDCGQDLKIDGEDSVGVFNSSDWAERAFCKKCGSSLYYKLKQNSQYIVSTGIMKGPNFVFDHQVFIDAKPDYYAFANDTKNMTGEELFAAYAPKTD